MLIYPLRFLHLSGNEKKIRFNDAVSPNWYQIGTKLEDFYCSFYKRPLLEHFELSISSGDHKKTKHTEKEAIA